MKRLCLLAALWLAGCSTSTPEVITEIAVSETPTQIATSLRMTPATATAQPTATLTPRPTHTPRSTPASWPTFTPVPTVIAQIEPVAAGEIVFFRRGPNEQVFVEGIAHIEVWAMEADGSNQRKLMDYYPGGGTFSIAPSPDGQMLALNYDAAAVVLHLLTGEVEIVSERNSVVQVRWSADSSTLYYGQLVYNEAKRVQAFRVWCKQLSPDPTEPEMLLEVPYSSDEEGRQHGERLWVGEALPDGRFVLHRITEITESTVSLYDPETARETPLDPGIFVHDVSQDGSRVLVSKRIGSEWRLYLGSLLPDGGIEDLQLIEAQGTVSQPRSGRFLPGGDRILAERDARPMLIVLEPVGDGTYTSTSLGQTTDYIDSIPVGYPVMYSHERILAERFSRDGVGEVWWLLLDGSEGTYLADGYMPLIVRVDLLGSYRFELGSMNVIQE